MVQLIAEGHSNKSIAELLGISLKTVETHRSAVMRKLNLPSSAALVRYAVRNKIVASLSGSCPRRRRPASDATIQTGVGMPPVQ